MRSDVEKDEFKYDCAGSVRCDFNGNECCSKDCRCCEVYNRSALEIHKTEVDLVAPYDGEICTINGVNYIKNVGGTIAKFDSVDDVITAFSLCTFFDMNYSPNEMYSLYPLFFKLKAYFSLGVPVRLLGNGEDSPLISAFKDGSVYVVSVRKCSTRWQ